MPGLRFTCRYRCALWFVLLLLPLALQAEPGRQDLQQIQAQIRELSGQLGSDRKNRDELLTLLSRTEKKIGQTTSTLRSLEAEQAALDKHLQSLETRQSTQQRKLDDNRYQLNRLLVSAYAAGRQEKLKLLLNQQDPALMNRMMTYYRFLNEQRLEKISQIEALLTGLQTTRADIQQTRGTLQAGIERQNAELDLLQEARQARAVVIAELNRSISTNEQSLDRLEQDRKALTSLLDKLEQQEKQKQQDRQIPIGKLKGKLPWPTSGSLLKLFGQSKAGDVNWDGVLISGAEGQEVRAVHYGRVVYADWLRGYGLLTIIDHGNGIMSLYGHNQSLLKDVGEWVDRQEPIALIGNSGGYPESGLYFSIRHKGKPANPKRWCQKPHGKRVSDKPVAG